MKEYIHTVLAGVSHLFNALTGGQPRYSFSARVGAAAYKGKRWARVVASVIDAVLFSRQHCLEQARDEGLI